MATAVYLEICDDPDPWATCRSWLTTVDRDHGRDAIAELERSTPREARPILHHLLYTQVPMSVITSALRRGFSAHKLLEDWCYYQADSATVIAVQSNLSPAHLPG